jgi:hypothetical protein
MREQRIAELFLICPNFRANARKYYLCVMKSIQEYISEVEDFRIEKKCLHKLSDILLIGLFT